MRPWFVLSGLSGTADAPDAQDVDLRNHLIDPEAKAERESDHDPLVLVA